MRSIFDGWEKKIDFELSDGRGGFCARGWIMHQAGLGPYLWQEMPRLVRETEARIGGWIEANLAVPDIYKGYPGAVIAWANNSHALDIEGFRRVDLLTQQDTLPEMPEDMPEMPDYPTPSIGEPIPITEPDREEPIVEPAAELVLVA